MTRARNRATLFDQIWLLLFELCLSLWAKNGLKALEHKVFVLNGMAYWNANKVILNPSCAPDISAWYPCWKAALHIKGMDAHTAPWEPVLSIDGQNKKKYEEKSSVGGPHGTVDSFLASHRLGLNPGVPPKNLMLSKFIDSKLLIECGQCQA